LALAALALVVFGAYDSYPGYLNSYKNIFRDIYSWEIKGVEASYPGHKLGKNNPILFLSKGKRNEKSKSLGKHAKVSRSHGPCLVENLSRASGRDPSYVLP